MRPQVIEIGVSCWLLTTMLIPFAKVAGLLVSVPQVAAHQYEFIKAQVQGYLHGNDQAPPKLAQHWHVPFARCIWVVEVHRMMPAVFHLVEVSITLRPLTVMPAEIAGYSHIQVSLYANFPRHTIDKGHILGSYIVCRPPLRLPVYQVNVIAGKRRFPHKEVKRRVGEGWPVPNDKSAHY